jgi:hypothetical protein
MNNHYFTDDYLEEYHNKTLERFSKSFGGYEANKDIIKENLKKYKIIYVEFGNKGESNFTNQSDNNTFPCGPVPNFYIIYVSINGKCYGNYLNTWGSFQIVRNYLGYTLIDWDYELFKKPFERQLEPNFSKTITKSILDFIIINNSLTKFISKHQPTHCSTTRSSCGLIGYNPGGFNYTGDDIFSLYDEEIERIKKEEIIEKKRREQEKNKEKERLIEKRKELLKKFTLPKHVKNMIIEKAIKDKDSCPITIDELTLSNIIVTNCGHVISIKGLFLLFESKVEKKCPVCREKLIK